MELTGTNTLGQSEPGSNGNKEVHHSPKFQNWNLTIRWFSVIFRILIGRGKGLTPQQRCSWCILQFQLIGLNSQGNVSLI